MSQQFILRRSLRGMAAASLFPLSLVAAAQTAPAIPEAVVAMFKNADTDADGKLSKEEAVKVPGLLGRFDALDKDHDGFLSLAEFAAGYEAPK